MSTLPMQQGAYGQPVMQDISSQRKLAEQLRAQSQEQLNGQMVGNHYVPASWTQHLAKVLQGYGANKIEGDARTKETEINNQKMAHAQKLAKAISPQQEEIAQDYTESGGMPLLPQQVTRQPNPQDIRSAVNEYYANTGNSDAIAQNALSSIKGADEWSETPRYDQNGQAYLTSKSGNIKYLDGIQQAPNATVAPNGQMINTNDVSNLGKNFGKSEIVNGRVIGNPSQLPVGSIIPQEADYNKPFLPDGTPNKAYQQYEIGKARSGASVSNVSVNTGQKGFDNTLKLRGDFRGEPVYKAHQEVQSAHAQITSALSQASPAGDLAGATKLMKILDPGSVVRESELGMAMAASGAMDRLTNYASNVISGNKLTPTQRKDFKALADSLYKDSANLYNAKREEYKGISDRNGLNEADVLGSPDNYKPVIKNEIIPSNEAMPNRPKEINDLLKKYGSK